MRVLEKPKRTLGAVSIVMAALAVGVAPVLAAKASEIRLVRSGVAHDMLFDIAFEGQKGIAVGDYGNVLISDNGGLEWQPAGARAEQLALLGTAISAGRCLAVGQGGTALVADDCRDWREVDSGSSERLMSVGLNANGLAYAVGAFGTVLRSADGGHSWESAELDWSALSPTGAEPHLYGVHVSDDGLVTLVGEFGLILRGSQGSEWRVAHSGDQSLFGLSVVGEAAYAVGQGGVVLSSSDGGETWRALETGVSALLTGVWSDGVGRVIVSGLNTILQSEDGGRNWLHLDAGEHGQSTHMAVAASKSEGSGHRILVVGSSAAVLQLTP